MSASRALRAAVLGTLALFLLACSALTSETPITGEIDVEILGRQGQPIPGARVILYTGPRHVQYLRTDATGRGRFTLVTRAEYGVFVPIEHRIVGLGNLSPSGDEGNIVAPIRIEGGDRGSARFTLLRVGLGRFEVTVRDSTGAPVPNVPTTLFTDVADEETRDTDANGVVGFDAPFGPVGVRIRVARSATASDSITLLHVGEFMDAGHRVARTFTVPVQ